MSTAGKILSILIIVPLVAWVCLASGVAELNRNYGQRIKKTGAEIATTHADIRTGEEGIADARRKIDLIQRIKDDTLTALRSQYSQIHTSESRSKEGQDRFNLQYASTQESLAGAQRREQLAERLLAESKKARDDAVAERQVAKAAHAAELARLNELRSQLSETLADNRAMVEKELKAEQAKSAPADTPTVAR